MTKQPKIHPMVKLAFDHEEAIRTNYRAQMMGMQDDACVRDEEEWNNFCDQDQLYYLAFYAAPGLEEMAYRVDKDDDDPHGHNLLTDYLNAIFEVEAKLLGFDGSV